MLRLEGLVFLFGTAISAPLQQNIHRRDRDTPRIRGRQAAQVRPDTRPATRQSRERAWRYTDFPRRCKRCGHVARIARRGNRKDDPAMLIITLVTAGACALIALWLGFRVARLRRARGINIGDGGDPALTARMRAQANFVEYAPFVLILLGLIEHADGGSIWLWLAAAAFVLGRVVHAFGMDGWLPGRQIGIATTLLVLLALGLYAIALPFYGGKTGTALDDGIEIVPPAA
ncbi:MAPEG family protein [Stakelama saccharophila]|uniref:MAPEG family protein n=1 Tax=Stakelama saccharophila TaxID=3075605 RepID=A0ABZ0B988_9SPHN|nr:MAPEG family protein [Stakelama sp. W311]WNO53976.1 MAPEG family protein [Stakelama sp. W311]